MSSAPTLVILGAGATRGASFVGESNLHLPPLDADFFRLLQLSPAGRSQQARALLKYVRDNHSPTLDASMEAIFVELQGAAEFYEQFNVGRGRILREPQRTIDHFYSVLPAVMAQAIREDCSYHNVLAEKLEPKDAVISLNYDCLMDEGLRGCAARRWNPREGYGLDVIEGADRWRVWGSGRTAHTPIRLLKLHGSLNWDVRDDGVALIGDPYARVSAAGAVVPPLGRKPVAEAPFLEVWKEARIRVKSARRLIVIGFSLPPADYLVRSLLRADLDANQLKEIVIVDPATAVADRFLQLLTRVPSRVETFGSFTTFADFLLAD